MKIKSIAIPLILLVVFLCAFFGCGGKKIEVSVIEENVSSLRLDFPNVKVFIENSGSMDGYMCDGSQLKDAIYAYVSDLNDHSDTTELYYINSTVIPYKGNLNSYIKDLNPQSFCQAGGNRANTDLGDIMAKVLKNIDDTTVAIFVSDCILDLPSKDATKFLTNCEIRLKDEIVNARKRVSDLGVEILQLTSDFNGYYYYPGGEKKILKDVKRPYYMWIIGDKNYLAKLNKDVPLSGLKSHGLNNNVVFTNKSVVPFEIKNRTLSGTVVNSNHGDYQVTIRADFLTTLQPDDVITNVNNFSFNNSNIKVESVNTISKESSTGYTHYINFTIPKGTNVADECLTLKCNQLPNWVSESDDTTGIGDGENITTGIKSLIQGVKNAYKGENVCAEMKFEVKRK